MDTSDPDIVFDENGYCNHCINAIQQLNENYGDRERNARKLQDIINLVKIEGKGKEYDCLIGLSGGIDSSYLAYLLVKRFGIRPLAIHVDNGWNSEQAVSNIHKIVSKLNIDLITHVIEWNEFKELQKSFLRASVVDLEMLSDHAIVVVINKISRQRRIKYFLIGSNFQTESIVPRKWFYSNKKDSSNILDIYRQFGSGLNLKTYPFLSLYDYLTFGRKYGKYLVPLSFSEYNKENAKEVLIRELGWQDYGAKHHESFITKFYQTIILPEKFTIDKRRAHLSSLICAGQISRNDALVEIKKSVFKNDNERNDAVEYFCKKLELTNNEFQLIMKIPRSEHTNFNSYSKSVLFKFVKSLLLKK